MKATLIVNTEKYDYSIIDHNNIETQIPYYDVHIDGVDAIGFVNQIGYIEFTPVLTTLCRTNKMSGKKEQATIFIPTAKDDEGDTTEIIVGGWKPI